MRMLLAFYQTLSGRTRVNMPVSGEYPMGWRVLVNRVQRLDSWPNFYPKIILSWKEQMEINHLRAKSCYYNHPELILHKIYQTLCLLPFFVNF